MKEFINIRSPELHAAYEIERRRLRLRDCGKLYKQALKEYLVKVKKMKPLEC